MPPVRPRPPPAPRAALALLTLSLCARRGGAFPLLAPPRRGRGLVAAPTTTGTGLPPARVTPARRDGGVALDLFPPADLPAVVPGWGDFVVADGALALPDAVPEDLAIAAGAFVAVASLLALSTATGGEEDGEEGRREEDPSGAVADGGTTTVAEGGGGGSLLDVLEDGDGEDLVDEVTAIDEEGGGKKGALRGPLSRLVGMVRAGRASAKEQTVLREEADARLADATEQLLDLEDKYELEQTVLSKTRRELGTVRSELESARTKLGKTTKDLVYAQSEVEELREERRSLRKLGRAAWALSKERVRSRFSSRPGSDGEGEQ